VRIVPNRPQLDAFSADISLDGLSVAHANGLGYGAQGIINVPLAETIAFRVDASYDATPGFINQYGILARGPGSATIAVPLLADPSDVAHSPGIFYNRDGVNYNGVASTRAELLWEPVKQLQVNVSYQHSRAFGGGENIVTPDYAGGPDYLDPRITQPAAGEWDYVARTQTPWERAVDLTTVEASYDMGFATLNSATGYYDSGGHLIVDWTGYLSSFPGAPYYVGVPTNPRFLSPSLTTDADETFSQELRLASATGGAFDWAVGAFYLHQNRKANWQIYSPGATEQGTAADDELIPRTGPDGLNFVLFRHQDFTDKSLFSELTWHLSNRMQITAGARQFWEDIDVFQFSEGYGYNYTVENDESNSTSAHVFKLNASFDLSESNRLYATWSQGFRRGGVNSFPLTGGAAEPSSLLVYRPDTTNNYEVGFKGILAKQLLYTFDVFDVDWKAAQLDTFTPINLWPVVVNSNGARSRGVEMDVTFKSLDDRLTATISGAYVDAKLTSSFSLNAAFGVPIVGTDGSRLPGSPQSSVALLLSYEQQLSSQATIKYSLTGSYNGNVITDLQGARDYLHIPSYSLWNASVMFNRSKHWAVGLFGNNLFDKQVISGELNYNLPTTQYDFRYVGQPRVVGIRLNYSY
jgi:outer membrane receptor protein involved in Fe transport